MNYLLKCYVFTWIKSIGQVDQELHVLFPLNAGVRRYIFEVGIIRNGQRLNETNELFLVCRLFDSHPPEIKKGNYFCILY